jgi:signal transduction histidine kinase
MLLIFLSEFVVPSDGTAPYEMPRLKRALRQLDDQNIDLERIPEVVQEASPHAEVFILDSENRIVETSAQVDSIMDLLNSSESTATHNIITIRIRDSLGAVYSVIVSLPVARGLDPMARYRALIIPASFLAFLTIMSILIIRSINASISRLEEATRRISEGDLDFQLHAEGGDSIASLTRSFDAMRKRVQEEAAARSRFLMAVSHDLKTPLSSISGYLDAIQDGLAESPENLDKYISIIRDKSGVLEGRIRQLIDFVKLETGSWQSSREDVVLAPFLDEAVTIFATEAEARGHSLESAIEVDSTFEVSMDSDLVFRVFENLINNAFQHAEPGSPIEYQAVQSGHEVEVRVCNRGQAILEDDLPFIFEPFYRGSKSRRENGFGLGLSVVKSVVTSHGWQIDVSSQEGKTCFTVTIPDTGDPGAGE